MSPGHLAPPAVLALLAFLIDTPVGGVAAVGRCDEWPPPATPHTLRVRTVSQLYDAVGHAQPGTTILLESGDYRLVRTLEIATPRLVLRTVTGQRAQTTLRGEGMSERHVGVAIAIAAD